MCDKTEWQCDSPNNSKCRQPPEDDSPEFILKKNNAYSVTVGISDGI